MDRGELKKYIFESYGIEPDCPWPKYPSYEVFRHGENRKWFALVMDIPRCRLGLDGDEVLTVVNLKCDPLLIGALRREAGFFPAYHMNKEQWITAALDGSADGEKLKMLVDMSYEATLFKRKAPAKDKPAESRENG